MASAPLLLALVSCALGPAASMGSCRGYTWTPPRALMTADGKLVHVPLPGIAQLNEALFLVGSPILLSDSSGLRTNAAPDGRGVLAGAAWSIAADTVALLVQPESVGVMYQPIAVEGNGTVDILWAELDTTFETPRPKSTIWQSTVDTSLAWTDPAILATRDGLAWMLNVYTNPVRLRDEQVRLIAPLQQVFHLDTVVVLTRSGRTWSAEEKVVARIGYGGLASDSDSVLVLSYVMGAEPDMGNTLFVKRSLDGGESWSDTTRVSPPGAGVVYDPRLLASGDSTFYLVWEQHSRPEGTVSIRLATSRDFGETWLYDAALPLPAGSSMSSLTAVVDRFGHAHLIAVVSMPESDRQTLLHATWSDGVWVTNTELLGNSVIGSSPWITALSNGEILIGWGVLAHWNGVPFEPYDGMFERPPDPVPAVATVVTRGRSACLAREQVP